MKGLSIRPLTPKLWPQVEDLFGPKGACSGCWCMWWRLARKEFVKGQGAANKAAFRRIVKTGPPPGLLAFDGDKAVGWCQLMPRRDLPVLGRSPLLAAVDDTPVWSVSCFYVRKEYRRQGVTAALIAAAVTEAKRQGAPALEAYPWDTAQKKGVSTVYTGVASTFERAGFRVVARRAPHRPVMRKTFKKTAA